MARASDRGFTHGHFHLQNPFLVLKDRAGTDCTNKMRNLLDVLAKTSYCGLHRGDEHDVTMWAKASEEGWDSHGVRSTPGPLIHVSHLLLA
jgi:hypothetical protein